MRFFVINTDYAEFIRDEYGRHPGLAEETFDVQLEHRYATLFGMANFYSKNLQALGHHAIDIIANHPYLQTQWAREHGLSPTRKRRLLRRDHRDGWRQDVLMAQIEEFRPDVIYNMAMGTIPSSFLNDAKHRVGARVVGQFAETVTDVMADLSAYDIILSSLPNLVDYFTSLGARAAYFRLGFESTILDFFKRPQPRNEVVFIGGLGGVHSGASEVIEHAARFLPALRVWGFGVDGFAANSPLRQAYQGKPLFGRTMYEELAASKVSINRHAVSVAGNFANNMRLYEVTGVGTALVTDQKANLPDIFEPGREVLTYATPDDLVNQVNLLLNDDDLRADVAAAGQRRTLQDHTFAYRMEELISIVQNNV
jgi:spore maturation protein CgeB